MFCTHILRISDTLLCGCPMPYYAELLEDIAKIETARDGLCSVGPGLRTTGALGGEAANRNLSQAPPWTTA
jgi:hypothetical protein